VYASYDHATTGDQGRLRYFMYFPWLPEEAALSILNASLKKKKKQYFENEFIKTE